MKYDTDYDLVDRLGVAETFISVRTILDLTGGCGQSKMLGETLLLRRMWQINRWVSTWNIDTTLDRMERL